MHKSQCFDIRRFKVITRIRLKFYNSLKAFLKRCVLSLVLKNLILGISYKINKIVAKPVGYTRKGSVAIGEGSRSGQTD